jgi:hypothetical protein
MDLLIQLAERHGLWAQLAEHHRIVAACQAPPRATPAAPSSASARPPASSTSNAATCSPPCAPSSKPSPTTPAQTVLPKIRELAAALDEARAEGSPRVGSLSLLAVLQQMIGADGRPQRQDQPIQAARRDPREAARRTARARWPSGCASSSSTPAARRPASSSTASPTATTCGTSCSSCPRGSWPKSQVRRRPAAPAHPDRRALRGQNARPPRVRPARPHRRLEIQRRQPSPTCPVRGDLGPVHGALWKLAAAGRQLHRPAGPA